MFKNLEVFFKQFDNVFNQMEDRLVGNMIDAIDMVGERANYYVPVDTGATKDSLFTDIEVQDGLITGIVGYDVERAFSLRNSRRGFVGTDPNYIITNHEDINRQFRTDNNPNASPQWLLKAVTESVPEINEELNK